jgi:ASC-1-like (ASCH) protein
MAAIHKKVWQEHFEEIISGKKKFELRLADFEINEGDTLVLEEWDKNKKEHTGRKVEVAATYILKTKGQTFWPPEEVEKYGFQIIQLEPVPKSVRH